VCLCVLTVQMAVGMGVQIMSVEWVEKCWDQRNDSLISATDEHLVMCKKSHFDIYCVHWTENYLGKDGWHFALCFSWCSLAAMFHFSIFNDLFNVCPLHKLYPIILLLHGIFTSVQDVKNVLHCVFSDSADAVSFASFFILHPRILRFFQRR